MKNFSFGRIATLVLGLMLVAAMAFASDFKEVKKTFKHTIEQVVPMFTKADVASLTFQIRADELQALNQELQFGIREEEMEAESFYMLGFSGRQKLHTKLALLKFKITHKSQDRRALLLAQRRLTQKE